MAKKRKMKDQEAEEAGFKVPEFDRDEYMQKEVRDGKMTIVTMVYAAIFAMFSFVVALYGDDGTRIGIFIGFGGMFTLRHFHRLAGFNTDELEVKHLIGYSMLFLFTWLAIWTVMSNPPASDISAPSIEVIEIREEVNGTWVRAEEPYNSDTPLRVYVKVYDYGDLDVVTLKIVRNTDGDTSELTPMIEAGDNWYYADTEFEGGGGATVQYTLVITAEDTAENTSTRNKSINVSS
jgi:hypothetical protein